MQPQSGMVMAVAILYRDIVADLPADAVAAIIPRRDSRDMHLPAVLQEDTAGVVAIQFFVALFVAVEGEVLDPEVLKVLAAEEREERRRSQPTWRFVGAGATVTNPYLRQYQIQDGPKNTFRDSFSVKADWKPARYHVLTVGAQVNYYHSFFGNRNTNFDVGASEVPTPATGVPLTFGPAFAYGATGRGTVTQGASFRDKYGATRATRSLWPEALMIVAAAHR